MPIDPEILTNSKATVAAWAAAIYRGLEDWVHNRPIYEVVKGIQAPTFRRVPPPPSGGEPGTLIGGDPDGCCLAAMPPRDLAIDGLEELIDRIRNLADYLDFVRKHL